MKPAIALDVTGVLISSNKAIPGAGAALSLLKQKEIPFVLLTNAGGRTEDERAQIINRILGDNIVNKNQIIQAHTPLRSIWEKMRKEKQIHDNQYILLGGSEKVNEIVDGYGFDNKYLTIEEICAVYPKIIPLSSTANFPRNPEQILSRMKKRLNINDKTELGWSFLKELQFKSIMMFNNPYMYEANIQVLSDVLISKDGRIGSQRSLQDSQYVKFFYSNNDLLIPANSRAEPHQLPGRYALGAFKICLETIFKKQYGEKFIIQSEVVGKPSKYAFDNARLLLNKLAGENGGELKYIMIGDNIHSDIVGGNQNGFNTILVETGLGTINTSNLQIPDGNPKLITKDVLEAVQHIIRTHP